MKIVDQCNILPWSFSSTDNPVVYHYTSVAAAQSIVETQSIWLSEHTAMNDSSEFIYARDKLFQFMRHRQACMDFTARMAMTCAVEGLTDVFGLVIASLSAGRDDLTHWRNYGDNGAGCVIGLNANYLENEAGVAIRTVIYNRTLIDQMLHAAIKVIQNQYVEAPDDIDKLIKYARHTAADLFCCKHDAFADEREVRISRMLLRDGDGTLSDPGGNRFDGGSVLPVPVSKRHSVFGETAFIALPLKRPDTSSAIVDIGLGPTTTTNNRFSHQAFFENHDIPVWQSTLPYRVSKNIKTED